MKRSRRWTPRRGRRLSPAALSPLGVIADSAVDVAGARTAIDRIDGDAWTSYGGWWSDADGVAHRGWVQQRPHRAWTFLLQVIEVLGSAHAASSEVRQPGGGWLNVEVRPRVDGPGSSVEVRGDIDAQMHASVDEALHDLRATVVRTWDPTIP
jgi:hypothetical protein